MPSFRVELKADGIRETVGEFYGLAHRAADVKPAWQAFTRYLMASERQLFQGQRWKPLDADTVRQKGNARILHLSGVLQDALTVWRAPGQKLRIGKQSMTFGLQPNGVAYYGVFHQDGDSVPVRKPLDPPAGAPRRASDYLMDHLLGRL